MKSTRDIVQESSLLSFNGCADDEIELAFLARQLVQCTLPHRDPGDVPVWTRRNGELTLLVTRTDVDDDGRLIGYPYGSLPRLLLYWINSEAVRTKSRRLELGDNLSRFMVDLGLNPRNGRGERSDARRLQIQMQRLFAASIRFKHRTEAVNGDLHQRSKLVSIVEDSELWWNPRHVKQGYLWGSWIELGPSFYSAITASPIPLNMTALKTLKRSPLALDLYSWVCYRSWRVTKQGAKQRVSWDSIHAQFGSQYSDVKDFRKKAMAALKKIVQTQPELKLTPVPGYIEIHPGVPVIPAQSAQ
ncbi:MAG: replication protein RepA [Bryobacteraceae bacterium]